MIFFCLEKHFFFRSLFKLSLLLLGWLFGWLFGRSWYPHNNNNDDYDNDNDDGSMTIYRFDIICMLYPPHTHTHHSSG